MANPVMAKAAIANGDLERRAERIILARVRALTEPADPSEIVAKAADEVPERALLFALWSLARDGKVEFTPDWRVRAAR